MTRKAREEAKARQEAQTRREAQSEAGGSHEGREEVILGPPNRLSPISIRI